VGQIPPHPDPVRGRGRAFSPSPAQRERGTQGVSTEKSSRAPSLSPRSAGNCSARLPAWRAPTPATKQRDGHGRICPKARGSASPLCRGSTRRRCFPKSASCAGRIRLAAAQQATRYRLIPLAPPEWNAEALQATLPDYLIISEFESRDVARIGRADYQAFMRVVEERYTLLRVFENEPPLLERREDMPHDLLYICPKIYIYRLREN
jgi:hypothetical protein